MLSGPRGRAASLEMTSCPGWKKQATSGQRLPCRWCTRCGVNVAHWSTPSRRSRRCSALARCAPRFILMYFLKTCTHTHTHRKSLVHADVGFILPAGGHAVEARRGRELRHLPVAQLAVRVSAAEDRPAPWTDLSQIF